MGDVSKILLIILAIFLPPIAVLLARGCSIHLLINIILLIVTFDIGAIIVCYDFRASRLSSHHPQYFPQFVCHQHDFTMAVHRKQKLTFIFLFLLNLYLACPLRCHL